MLQKLGFLPGFNKQVTETGAEGQWFDGDNVRFRYGTPEKIGGWTQLGDDKLTGAARAIHHWDDNAGIKYAAIGTNRILYVYSGGVFYDMFGNYDYAWYLAILLSFVATLLHLPIDEKPIKREATI